MGKNYKNWRLNKQHMKCSENTSKKIYKVSMIVKVKDSSRIRPANIKFMRWAAKYIWKRYKRNTSTMCELHTESSWHTILDCRYKWICHIHRIQMIFPDQTEQDTKGDLSKTSRHLRPKMVNKQPNS